MVNNGRYRVVVFNAWKFVLTACATTSVKISYSSTVNILRVSQVRLAFCDMQLVFEPDFVLAGEEFTKPLWSIAEELMRFNNTELFSNNEMKLKNNEPV